MAEKNKGGAPSTYTDEIGAEICEAISTSTEGLRKLCAKHPHWPDAKVIIGWCFKHRERFGKQYDEARRRQAELSAELLHEIAEDIPTFTDDKGVERVDSGMLGKYKLLSDTKKWQASKLAPKVWGDKQHIAVEESSNTEELKQEILKLRAELEAEKKKDY